MNGKSQLNVSDYSCELGGLIYTVLSVVGVALLSAVLFFSMGTYASNARGGHIIGEEGGGSSRAYSNFKEFDPEEKPGYEKKPTIDMKVVESARPSHGSRESTPDHWKSKE